MEGIYGMINGTGEVFPISIPNINDTIEFESCDLSVELAKTEESIGYLQPIETKETYYYSRIQIIKDNIKHTKKEYEKISLQKELGRLDKELRMMKRRGKQ